MDPELVEINLVSADRDESTRTAVGVELTILQNPLPLPVEKILLIWEEVPETSSFHLIPFKAEYLKLHGLMLGMSLTEEEANLIEELNSIKGSPLEDLKIPEDCKYFLQSGVMM